MMQRSDGKGRAVREGISMKTTRVLVVLGAFVAVIAAAPAQNVPSTSAPSEMVEEGLTYGHDDSLPLPKTILFSTSPDEIVADAEEWSRRGINAFFMDYVARNWSSDIWAADDKPWTIGESDETFQKAKNANAICKRIGSETFLKIAFDHPFEWFNETAWQQIDHNFRQFAIFARDTGCTGLALDIEYISEQYAFDWDGYTYDGYTRADLAEQVRKRMTRVAEILYDEFPDMVFVTFPEEGFSLGSVIHAAWIEEAARRDAPGGIHYCTEYTYRNPNIRYMFAHAWACNELFQNLLSDRAKAYWAEKCSISEGVWPFGFNYEKVHSPGLTVEQFRQGYAASLMVSRRYNWIYSHNSRPQLIGRDVDQYSGEAPLQDYLDIMAEKAIVTTPKYLNLAQELRGMTVRDYSGDLGLVPAVLIAGPDDIPKLSLVEQDQYNAQDIERGWKLGAAYIAGELLDLRKEFGTVTDWMLIGPFPSPQLMDGHNTEFPPEQGIDLTAEYPGVEGAVHWQAYHQADTHASVDLTRAFNPTEHVTAYALCYVHSPSEQKAYVRVGTNDAGKVWLGDKLILDHAAEGTAYLDRDIIPVTIPAGTTPILVKVTNGQNDWGFVFRITDERAKPLEGLRFSLKP